MENASKALIMAAGILIGILIASLFAYEMIEMTRVGNAYKHEIDQKSIDEFNARFAKYLGVTLKVQDVVTLVGFADEYNSLNENGITIWPIANSTTELYLYINKKGKYASEDSKRDAEFLAVCNKTHDDTKKEVEFIIDRFYYASDGHINKIAIKYK